MPYAYSECIVYNVYTFECRTMHMHLYIYYIYKELGSNCTTTKIKKENLNF